MKKSRSKIVSISFIFIVIVIGNTVIAAQNNGPDMTIDSTIRERVINNLLKDLNDHYIFPEVSKKIESDIKLAWRKREKVQKRRKWLAGPALFAGIRTCVRPSPAYVLTCIVRACTQLR